MIDYESLYDNFVKGRMVPFYTVMYPRLLTFASRLLGPSLAFMAEDCVQDAVMTTYEHAGEIDDAFHWRWYLMRCIRYKASNLVRHKGVADGYAQALEGDDSDEDAGMERDISYALIRQETLDRLFAAIDRLPPQIARLLDVAEITVKKRKARMLEMLRGWLGPETDMLIILYLLSVKG